MGEEGLRELLARVHQHLSAGGPVEGDVRQQLAVLMRDIERTLSSGGGANPPQAAPRTLPIPQMWSPGNRLSRR